VRLDGPTATSAMQSDVKLIAVLSRSGIDATVQEVQMQHAAKTKIDAIRARRVRLGEGLVSLRQVITSQYGVGVMADRAVHSGEGKVLATVAAALRRVAQRRPRLNVAVRADAAAAEEAVVAALEQIDAKRANSFGRLSREPDSYRE
jgi:hypothetical protein